MNWKKKDAVLILTVLLIAGAALGVHEFAGGDGADTVTVKVDGKEMCIRDRHYFMFHRFQELMLTNRQTYFQ